MLTAAIIPAAGRGLRMGGEKPKQFLMLQGRPILAHTLAVFEACPQVDLIIPVLPPRWEEQLPELATVLRGFHKVSALVTGGEQRQDSVENALLRLSPQVELVLVHDGVRPFVSPSLVVSCLEAARRHGAAVAALRARETVKLVDGQGRVEHTIPRDKVYLAQTPQAFRRHILEEAFARARQQNFYGTDESSLVERLGIEVRVVPGEPANIKITTPEDLAWARMYALGRERGGEARGG